MEYQLVYHTLGYTDIVLSVGPTWFTQQIEQFSSHQLNIITSLHKLNQLSLTVTMTMNNDSIQENMILSWQIASCSKRHYFQISLTRSLRHYTKVSVVRSGHTIVVSTILSFYEFTAFPGSHIAG